MATFPSSEKAFERHVEHFPSGNDLTLQVLKGHLLVEERIRDLLECQIPHPSALTGKNGASLSCHQAICVTEAITKSSTLVPWVWILAKRLNSLRNKLAHNLDGFDLEDSVRELISHAIKLNPSLQDEIAKFNAANAFEIVIMHMSSALAAIKSFVINEGSPAEHVA